MMTGKRTRQSKKEEPAKKVMMEKNLTTKKEDGSSFKTLPITLLSGFLVCHALRLVQDIF